MVTILMMMMMLLLMMMLMHRQRQINGASQPLERPRDCQSQHAFASRLQTFSVSASLSPAAAACGASA